MLLLCSPCGSNRRYCKRIIPRGRCQSIRSGQAERKHFFLASTANTFENHDAAEWVLIRRGVAYFTARAPNPDEPSNVQNSRWTRRENSQDTSSRSRSRSKPKPTDADVLRLVTAASRIPSKVTPELKKLAMEGIGEDGYQTVACIAGSFGWLNAITDTVGMELGLNDALFARSELAAVGWTGGRHAPPGLKEHQEPAASSGSEPPMNFWSSTSQSTLNRSQIMHAVANETTPRTGLARLIDYQLVLSHVAASSAQSDPWGSQIPTTHKKIDDWLVEKMGFLPSYVGVIKNLEAKRAVCLMLWVFLVRNNGKKGGGMGDPCVEGEPCEWTAGAKALMFYVYSTQIGNLLLRGHAAFLALRNHVPISVLLSTASSMPTHEPRLDAALDLVRATASLRRSFPATLNRRVFDTANSTKGIMELVNSIGLFNMLHRMSAMLAPEPVKFEKEVREFLSMFAPVLGMDPDDASPQGTEERRVVDPLQFLYPN
ncbi:hypothetical protein DFJ73DRAFT_157802 [Zopfochytrium polystomum]|nr:hypothetical protein DFJ73DRAFT_157802 [Zopfochytrium polystomum]